MSQRRGILVTHTVKAEGRWPLTRSPNKQPDVITVEVRMHWPHPAPRAEVIAALGAVCGKALAELEREMDGDR